MIQHVFCFVMAGWLSALVVVVTVRGSVSAGWFVLTMITICVVGWMLAESIDRRTKQLRKLEQHNEKTPIPQPETHWDIHRTLHFVLSRYVEKRA